MSAIRKDINDIQTNYYGEYNTVYESLIKKYNYDFLLYDESFFQYDFNESNGYIRYAFFQFPYDFPTYDNYLLQNGFDINEIGEALRTEYEQEISEANLMNNVYPIRYEYSIKDYKTLLHPASHLHIGYHNDIRISSAHIITPLVFTLFVIKNCYYDLWERQIQSKKLNKFLLPVKMSCHKIPATYFGDKDKYELFLV
ncbi:MAG: DUF2290 domain-containing protein [Syntrophothermus sp.]